MTTAASVAIAPYNAKDIKNAKLDFSNAENEKGGRRKGGEAQEGSDPQEYLILFWSEKSCNRLQNLALAAATNSGDLVKGENGTQALHSDLGGAGWSICDRIHLSFYILFTP